jgi:hypothetical protein
VYLAVVCAGIAWACRSTRVANAFFFPPLCGGSEVAKTWRRPRHVFLALVEDGHVSDRVVGRTWRAYSSKNSPPGDQSVVTAQRHSRTPALSATWFRTTEQHGRGRSPISRVVSWVTCITSRQGVAAPLCSLAETSPRPLLIAYIGRIDVEALPRQSAIPPCCPRLLAGWVGRLLFQMLFGQTKH